MKDFKDMTQGEIESMSDSDYKAVSPFDKKTCYDCGHLKSAMSWWCTSKEAKEARGTTIPGCIKCPYWKPDWSVIKDQYKIAENGYVKPIEKIIAVVNKPLKWYQKIFK